MSDSCSAKHEMMTEQNSERLGDEGGDMWSNAIYGVAMNMFRDLNVKDKEMHKGPCAVEEDCRQVGAIVTINTRDVE